MPAWIRITERVPDRTSAPSLCPGPRGPRAPAAEGDCLSTWGLEGGHGRAFGQNSDVRRAPGGRTAPVPPSRVTANHTSESGDGLLVFGATVTAVSHPPTRWMAPTPKPLGSHKGPGQRDQGVLLWPPGKVLSLPLTEQVFFPWACFLIWEMGLKEYRLPHRPVWPPIAGGSSWPSNRCSVTPVHRYPGRRCEGMWEIAGSHLSLQGTSCDPQLPEKCQSSLSVGVGSRAQGMGRLRRDWSPGLPDARAACTPRRRGCAYEQRPGRRRWEPPAGVLVPSPTRASVSPSVRGE